MQLSELQRDHKVWVEKNFPNQPLDHGFLGLVEEVGELSRAILKGEQGIRFSEEEILAMKKDAVGDIVLFLTSYCNSNDIDLDEAVREAWAIVSERDWTRFPKNGRTE